MEKSQPVGKHFHAHCESHDESCWLQVGYLQQGQDNFTCYHATGQPDQQAEVQRSL